MSTENTANKHDEEDCFNDIYDDAFLAELDLIESQQLNTLSGRLETASLATQQQATTTDHQPFDQSLDETDGLKHTIRRLEEKIEQINQARKEEDRRIHQERIELDFKRQEIESQRVKLLIIEQARQQEKPKEPTQSEKRKKGFPDQSYFQQSSSRSQKKSFSIQSQTISPSTHSLYQPIDYHQPKPIQPAVVLPLAQPSSKHQYTPIDIEQNHLHHLFDNIRNQWRKSHKNSPELDTAEASVLFINQLRPSTDNLKCQDQLNRLADDIDTLLRGSSTTPLAITVHILLRHIKQALLICIQMRQTKVIKKYLEFVSVLTSYYDEACLFIAWDTEQGKIWIMQMCVNRPRCTPLTLMQSTACYMSAKKMQQRP
ncbi:hypothetical protein CLU79DRAFT_567929 [Phycomyces nitens]|nr:hypothetical protein CLU79DRAFT_567929 [Phycomyces nitens]